MQDQSNLERLTDTTVHDWYRLVFAYSDRVITGLIDEWNITDDDLILDPFNGTGTTTVTAKLNGIDSIGTDASPIAVLSSQVKTTWDIDLDELRKRRANLLNSIEPVFKRIDSDENNTLGTFNQKESTCINEEIDLEKYDLSEPEKTPKDWLSEKPRKKMRVLQHHVNELPQDEITDIFELAMCAILPENVANIEFGPEAYRTKRDGHIDVYKHLTNKLKKIETDLDEIQKSIDKENINPGRTDILKADAREISSALQENSILLEEYGGNVDYVITSPPYPAEHDYTRNQRLELIWMGEIVDNDDLQRIKRANIRSNTKNIYVSDSEGEEKQIRENDRIDGIITEMENIIEEEEISHNFGMYYPRVVEEYFAGMQNHLEETYELLCPGGKAAYIVADSGSYWQVQIETGEILAELAENRVGFTDTHTRLWRNLKPITADYDDLDEEILILKKPNSTA